MDGRAAIERNGQALRRVLAALVVMAGLAGDRPTLPRRLRNAVLRLLRPAESAARRLVIALARGLAVTLTPSRVRASTATQKTVSGGIATGIVLARAKAVPAARSGASDVPGTVSRAPRSHALPLLDPPTNPFRIRRKIVSAHLSPRISTPGVTERRPLPPRPSPNDPVDARRLKSRLAALARVLGDLPGAARKFARWRALNERRNRRGERVRWPLRPGRPPGFSARRDHEVHAVLAHAHDLARWALEHPG